MANLVYDEVMQWSVDDVLQWLKQNKLTEFHDFVSTERIDGPDFIKLDKGRISNVKNVNKSKREALLKRLKEFEKEKAKMQKTMKAVPKTANGKPVPAVNAIPTPPPATSRGASHRPEDDGEDEYYDDEWDDDQDVYDNDEIMQPPRGRRSNPPPLPPSNHDQNDYNSDEEDYVEPADPPPSVRPPPPPPADVDDEDNLYERANKATIPGRAPPPRNPPAPTQRPVPPAPVQGQNVPPPRGGRAPVAPPPQPTSYVENERVSPPPPPRNASPPPALSRPPAPTAPKNSAPSGVRGRAPVPVPQPDEDDWYEETDHVQPAGRAPPQEIYEHPDENEKPPPSLPSVRDVHVRSLPPRPPSEVYEEPPEQEHANTDYESVEDLKAKMSQAPPIVHGRAPAPAPTDDPDEMYEMTDSVPRFPQTARQPPPPKPVDEDNYEETEKFQVQPPQLPPPAPSSSRPGQRAPPPRPAPDPEENYEATDDMPQMNERHEDAPPPQKPEKLQIGKKFNPGVPHVGIELDTVAIRDAKSKLRKAIPKGLSEPQPTTDKPHLKPDEVQSVGGIKAMIQARSQPQTPSKSSKVTPLPSPAARTAAVLPSRSTPEINAPGAPEPPRRQERALPPGPPGGPPETVNSPAVAATPPADPNDIKKHPWYFGDCERDRANKLLMESTEGGTYLVRDSKGSGQPYTLGIFYNGDIFNISIRKRPDGKFALGKEKPEEHVFETIYDMVRFHRNNAIEVSKNGVLAGRVKLSKIAEK